MVYSNTWSEHLQHLKEVLQRLQTAGLTLKLKKCILGAGECIYLGHQIGHGGVRPEQAKVLAIKQMAQPKKKKDVRAFLGITGYYRCFIRDYATIAQPLTDLTKKGVPEEVPWSMPCEEAFRKLKGALTSETVMKNPDFSKPFVLQTDASRTGVGAVLSQEDSPIAYYSRKLLDRERKYSTVEQECLAIVAGIKAFGIYLIGKPFVLQTDHRALQWLQKSKDGNARLLRWSLLLQPYSFTVEHRKGIQNGNADALSRMTVEPSPALRAQEGGGNVTPE